MIEEREKEFAKSKMNEEIWTELNTICLTKEEMQQINLNEFLKIVDRHNFERRLNTE